MGGVAACVFAVGCEANHTHVRGLALIWSEARPPQSSEDRTDERAADGLLVVQVCRLGTVSRKIPQAASPLIHRRDDGRILVSSPSARRSLTSGDAKARGMSAPNAGVGLARRTARKGEEAPVEVH
jgi:hypothetical protein